MHVLKRRAEPQRRAPMWVTGTLPVHFSFSHFSLISPNYTFLQFSFFCKLACSVRPGMCDTVLTPTPTFSSFTLNTPMGGVGPVWHLALLIVDTSSRQQVWQGNTWTRVNKQQLNPQLAWTHGTLCNVFLSGCECPPKVDCAEFV